MKSEILEKKTDPNKLNDMNSPRCARFRGRECDRRWQKRDA